MFYEEKRNSCVIVVIVIIDYLFMEGKLMKQRFTVRGKHYELDKEASQQNRNKKILYRV